MAENPNKQYEQIPLNKLEKIHYAQIRVLRDREKNKQYTGIQLKFKSASQIKAEMSKLLNDLFTNADKTYKGEPEELLGMRFLIATYYALPIEKLQDQEKITQKEIKRRKEIKRQQLDAGNTEKIIKGR